MALKIFSATLQNTATVNILPNPSFELDPVGSSTISRYENYASSGSVIRTIDDSISVLGDKSLKIAASTLSDGGVQTPIIFLPPSSTWSVSGYIKSGVSITNAHIIVQRTSDSAKLLDLEVTSANQDWTRKSGTVTASAGGTNIRLLIGMGSYTPTSLGEAWFDGIQLEQQSSATEYCDGDQNECFWRGLPHNSTSTREAINLSLVE